MELSKPCDNLAVHDPHLWVEEFRDGRSKLVLCMGVVKCKHRYILKGRHADSHSENLSNGYVFRCSRCQRTCVVEVKWLRTRVLGSG